MVTSGMERSIMENVNILHIYCIFSCVHMCVCVCSYVPVSAGTCGDQKRVLDPRELRLPDVHAGN